jgi:hypothetical protein
MRADMKILKKPDDQYRMTLSAAETRVFVNCMKATFDGIGDWEYPTRIGATAEQIKQVIDSLDRALK